MRLDFGSVILDDQMNPGCDLDYWISGSGRLSTTDSWSNLS